MAWIDPFVFLALAYAAFWIIASIVDAFREED